jgi:hypothetical protein
MTARPLAGRLAGGVIQPIEADVLHEAVRDAIATTRLGDLEPIQTLPDTNRSLWTLFEASPTCDASPIGRRNIER